MTFMLLTFSFSYDMKKILILLVFSFSFIVSYALPYKRASVVKSYRTSMKEKNFVQARQVLIDAMREHSEAASDAQLYRFNCEFFQIYV